MAGQHPAMGGGGRCPFCRKMGLVWERPILSAANKGPAADPASQLPSSSSSAIETQTTTAKKKENPEEKEEKEMESRIKSNQMGIDRERFRMVEHWLH